MRLMAGNERISKASADEARAKIHKQVEELVANDRGGSLAITFHGGMVGVFHPEMGTRVERMNEIEALYAESQDLGYLYPIKYPSKEEAAARGAVVAKELADVTAQQAKAAQTKAAVGGE